MSRPLVARIDLAALSHNLAVVAAPLCALAPRMRVVAH